MAFSPALVTLKTFRDPWDAYLLRGRLEAEGIPAFVLNDQHVAVNWRISTALGGVRVQVPTHMAAEAQAVWEGVAGGDYQALLATLFGDIETRRCPACGATDIRRRPLIGEIVIGILVVLLFGIPLKLSRPRCTCRVCGARWQEA
jgi:hypothetical protein